MEIYATPQDYAIYIHGGSLSGGVLLNMLQRASEQVDGLCFGRIRRVGFEHLTQFQQDCIRKAVCLHAEFLASYADALDSPLQSYGINGVSMTFDNTRVRKQGGVMTSSQAYGLLLQTGLAGRGVW